MLFTYNSWPWFYLSSRREILNPNDRIVKNIVPFQGPFVSEGGATMERHSFRNKTSNLKRWSLYLVRWPLDIVNGQWSVCPIKQPLSGISVCRNVNMEGTLKTTNPYPWQLPATKVGPADGKGLTRIMCQKCFGKPTQLRPQGFQCKTRLSYWWCSSNAK